jgi:MoaD family protein
MTHQNSNLPLSRIWRASFCMTIQLQFFSSLKDAAGRNVLEYSVREGMTVRELLENLYRDFPDLKKWDAHILVAVGVEYIRRDYVLKDSDVVSIMPPVQGG